MSVVTSLLQDIKSHVRPELYIRLQNEVNSFMANKGDKHVLLKTLKRVREELLIPRGISKKTSPVVIPIEDRPLFHFRSEPTEPGFLNSYYDIQGPAEHFRPDDPMERKGRTVKPVYLDSFEEFTHFDDGLITIGMDVAREGDDKTVLTVRHDAHVLDIQSFWREDTNETTGHLVDVVHEYRPDEVILDGTGGYGLSVYDKAIALGLDDLCEITVVKFNATPRDITLGMLNQRSEFHWLLRERFRAGLITLPYHIELLEELAWLKYSHRMGDLLMIQPKTEFKKMNKRSPDHADSLGLAFYNKGSLEVY
jgi:hypothetical protein